jgi:ribosomal protein L9
MLRGFWRSLGRATLVGLIATASTVTVVHLLPMAQPATAEATVLYGKNNEDKDKNKEKERREKEQNEDRVINGQVLEIDTLKDPPEIILGSVDGKTVIRVLKTDEIARNGVRLGDFIQADGEKLNEQLFEATQLSVSEHFSAIDTENDNKDK